MDGKVGDPMGKNHLGLRVTEGPRVGLSPRKLPTAYRSPRGPPIWVYSAEATTARLGTGDALVCLGGYVVGFPMLNDGLDSG